MRRNFACPTSIPSSSLFCFSMFGAIDTVRVTTFHLLDIQSQCYAQHMGILAASVLNALAHFSFIFHLSFSVTKWKWVVYMNAQRHIPRR